CLDPHERALPEREARSRPSHRLASGRRHAGDDLAARALRKEPMNGVVDLASRLVGCDTTSARTNLPSIELLAERLEGQGFRQRVQSWKGDGAIKANLVAVAGPPEPGGLIVCGHTDTVPWEGQPGWNREPLRLEIDDQRVYGRGTSDMKVFLAQAVVAADA